MSFVMLWNDVKYCILLSNLLFKGGMKRVFESQDGMNKYFNLKILNHSSQKSEKELYAKMHELFIQYHCGTIGDYIKSRKSRSTIRWNEITSLLENTNITLRKDADYLDFGAGDCSMSYLLGKRIVQSEDADEIKKHVFAIDIQDWSGSLPEYNIYRKKCRFSTYDSLPLPYTDDKFDIISVFQVLHHIEHLEETLNELYRITSDGGYLLVREHDCKSKKMRKLIEIEHILHDLVFKENVNHNETFSHYRSRKDLKKIIQSSGFKWLGKYHPTDVYWNPTNFYYEIYQK